MKCDQNNVGLSSSGADGHFTHSKQDSNFMRGEWPSGLNSLRQVTEVKLGRMRSDFGWVTTEA